MRCYNCGAQLSTHDFCVNCGVDVSVYKKIMMLSNFYYNEGLDRAGVRDLSGAVVSLRQSLKCNKNNVEARNLLGLVYFEMGETVAALCEWIISKNMRPNKNIADDYINLIQNNPSRLETINETNRKYNQALAYCNNDSCDLAIIQLKKVLSLNPKFIRAHQLLALCYMQREDYEKAHKELEKCLRADVNNLTALRYMKETEKVLAPDETTKPAKKKPGKDVIRYQSDNEIIIQPSDVKEPKSGVSSILNLAIGIFIGLAVAIWLIAPGMVSNERAKANEELRKVGEELDAKTANIAELEGKVSSLIAENDELHMQLDAYVGNDGTMHTIDQLLQAARIYMETPSDRESIAGYLESIEEAVNVEETSEAFQELYAYLIEKVGPDLSAAYYNEGNTAYQNGQYEEAISSLLKAVFYQEENDHAWYLLGNAYKASEENVQAIAAYQKVVDLDKNAERVRNAQLFLEELQANIPTEP